MAATHRYLVRKEILPCRCMRYVYNRGIDVVHCAKHASAIEGKQLNSPEVQSLLTKLYFTEDAHVSNKLGKRMVVGLLVCVVLFAFSFTMPPPTSYKNFSTTDTWQSIAPNAPALDPSKQQLVKPLELEWGLTKDDTVRYSRLLNANWRDHETKRYPQGNSMRTTP